jgi:hypothetical protein
MSQRAIATEEASERDTAQVTDCGRATGCSPCTRAVALAARLIGQVQIWWDRLRRSEGNLLIASWIRQSFVKIPPAYATIISKTS